MKITTIAFKTRLVALIGLSLISAVLYPQISINSLPYIPGSTNFNSFNPNSAVNSSATIPAGWSFGSSGVAAYNGQSISGSTAGGYWAYTYFLSGDYNLGAQRDGSVGNITYHVEYINNSGSPITNLVLSWDYEQWIFANASGWTCSGTGALAGNTVLTGKGYTGANSSFLNQATSTPVATFTLSGLNIANGVSFGISWTTFDDSGADNGVALDNFLMEASAVPSLTLGSQAISPATIFQASANNVLYRTDINVGPVPAVLNSAVFTTAGTYGTVDISNLKLWYSNNSIFSVGTATLLGSKTSTLGAGTKTFSSLSQNFPVGAGYLFLTADVPCNTTAGNNISVNAGAAGNYIFTSGNKSSSGFSAGGAQIISNMSLNAVASQTVCAGKNSAAVTFTTVPAGLTVNWNNNNTASGLPASGVGNIASMSVSQVSVNQSSNVTATVLSGVCPGNSVNFLVLVKSNNQSATSWLGSVSNDFSDAANWSNCACGSLSSVSISAVSAPAFNPLISTNTGMKNLSIQPGATLSVQNTQAIALYGDWLNNGSFIGQKGAVLLNGISTQTIGGTSLTSFYDLTLNNATGAYLSSPQEIRGNLALNSGVFDTNNKLTLAANAAESGRISAINAAADLINQVTVQQYAPGGATGWGLFGSPITSGLTMSDWNDNFSITCQSCPNGFYNFPSVYTYDESIPGTYDNGSKYVPITSITNSITHKTGYWVYYGTGQVNSSAINFDVSGTVAKSSCLSCTTAVTLPLSYTSNNGLSNDGWNLISNPLPSPISWTDLRNGNASVDNAIYVYNADLNGGRGAHASYVNGVSSDVIGGVTDNIAMCQGFYVHASAATTLTAGENIKTSTNPTFLRPVNAAKPIVRLVLKDNNGSTDMTTFYFEQGGSPAFQPEMDAYKLNFDPTLPSIGGMSDSILTSINGLPELPANSTVSLLVTTPVNGTFTLSALKNDFPSGICVTLYDVYTNISTNILSSDYVCTLYDTTTTARFTLKFFTTALAGSVSSVQPTCESPNGGVIHAIGMGSGPFNYEWKMGGSIVRSTLNVSGADSIKGLGGGSYGLKINTAGQCDLLELSFILADIITNTAAFIPNVQVSSMSVSGQVNFINQSSGSENYSWDFGDGSGHSTSESPWYNYSAPGIYTVTLIAQSSSNCMDTATKIIKVLDDATSIESNQTGGNIVLSTLAQGIFGLSVEIRDLSDLIMELRDMKGNALSVERVKQVRSFSGQLDLSLLPNGLYLLNVSNDKGWLKSFKLSR